MGVKILNLLIGMSYNMLKVSSSEFQSQSIKIRIYASGRDRRTEGGIDTCNPLGLALRTSQKYVCRNPMIYLIQQFFSSTVYDFNFKGQAKLCDHFLWQLLTSGMAKFINFLKKINKIEIIWFKSDLSVF